MKGRTRLQSLITAILDAFEGWYASGPLKIPCWRSVGNSVNVSRQAISRSTMAFRASRVDVPWQISLILRSYDRGAEAYMDRERHQPPLFYHRTKHG
jgi:hypothetical protein